MKKTIKILGLTSLITISGFANAQSFSSGANIVNNENEISRGEQRNSSTSSNNERNNEREPTVNDLLMASGNNLSDSTIQKISELQERKSLLDAQITTLEAERNYLELKRQIKALGGKEDMSNVSMVSIQGVNGNLSSVISYNDNLIEVSRGDIIANKWVISKVLTDKVSMLNLDDKSEMIVTEDGYQIILKEKDEAISSSNNEKASF